MTSDGSSFTDGRRCSNYPSGSSRTNSAAPICSSHHTPLNSGHKLLSKTTRVILYGILAPLLCFSGMLIGTFLNQLAQGQEHQWRSIGPANAAITRLAVENPTSKHQTSGASTTIIYAQTPEKVFVSADAQSWRPLTTPSCWSESDWFLLHTESGVRALAMTVGEAIEFSYGNSPRSSLAKGLSTNCRLFSLENCRTRPGTIYAAAEDKSHSEDKPDQLFKSTDAGVSWIPIRGWSDQANTTSLSDITVDPVNPDVVYLVLNIGGASTLAKTTNGGLTWHSTVFRGFHFDNLDLTFAPDNSRTLYILATAQGVATLYKSSDALKSIVLKHRFSNAYTIAIDPKNDRHLIVLSHPHQLYESYDGGETWDKLDTSELGKNVALSLAVDASGTIYLGTARNGIFMRERSHTKPQISRSPVHAPAGTTRVKTEYMINTTRHRTAFLVGSLSSCRDDRRSVTNIQPGF